MEMELGNGANFAPEMSQAVVEDLSQLPPPPSNTPPHQAAGTNRERVKDFWVSPPLLDPAEKAKYKNTEKGMFAAQSDSEVEPVPVEVVGEIRLGTDLYYWVSHDNDVVYRLPSKSFRQAYPDLVGEYEDAKDNDLLEPIDPNSSRIYPKDRIQLKPPAKATRSTARKITTSSRSKPERVVIDSDEASFESEDEESIYSSYQARKGKSTKSTRRSNRTVGKRTDYRDKSASPVSDSPARTRRRGLRSTAAAQVSDDDGAYVVEDDEDDDDNGVPVQTKTLSKSKAVRGRLSRAAYGNIRSVADLSDDESDHDDDYALHAHQGACDKCQKEAAHLLLAKFYQKKPTAKRGRKKSKDEFEESEDEEEALEALGGWVRCMKCCVTSHWKCLTRAQRDEILQAVKVKAKEAKAAGLQPLMRETLGAYDTTEFICNACIQGGICMYCHEVAVTPESRPALKADVENKKDLEKIVESTPGVSAKLGSEKNGTPPPANAVIDSIPPQAEGGDTAEKHSTIPKVVPELIIDVDAMEIDSTPNKAAPQPTLDNKSVTLFRCTTCKRLAHYEHLPKPDPKDSSDWTVVELAQHYQQENDWKCSDCMSFVHQLDRILAWRPYPENAVEPPRRAGEVPDHKALLPREYLVKWVDRSYRRLQWVPHMWLLSTSQSKLKNFLATGPKVQLLDKPIADVVIADDDTGLTAAPPASKETAPSFLINEETSGITSTRSESEKREEPAKALPDAEARIPLAWRTVDRVLDVRLWFPDGLRQARRKKSKSKKDKSKKKGRIESESEEDELNEEVEEEIEAERLAARMGGEEPNDDLLETVEQWESRNGEELSVHQAEDVIWAFIKWDELAYEEATWDSPPAPTDVGYATFQKAFQRFLDSRNVLVAKKDRKAANNFDSRPKNMFEQKNLALTSDPESGQVGKLMPFQLTGVNWLYRNWWRHQPSILADDMGLGKTVQIASFLGHLLGAYEASPTLVIVPNSTITNWLREFAKWAPRLRVVPFNGDAKSRDIIRRYELYHESVPAGYTKLKFDVLVTTYETLTGRDFTSVFQSVPRWELLIVDEGQRLKNDASLLFKRLNQLRAIHRILMTGTPLNNNIRELFNLMNFLDADKWSDLAALEKEHEVLTEELLLKLHERLKPYFLRRTKADVLKLPPKNEVIVPVSMTAIQKEVYKSLLSQNVQILGSLTQSTSSINNVVKKSNMNNLLMQLRKCLQHPYLISPELEPTGPHLTEQDTHVNLRDASAKLRLLHMMLPKLKARGHRVLLFSQFVMALDIIEDFITAEKYTFLRLDGDTPQSQRQKDMDLFNKPDSNVFIYLLSTRSGGVGINLWSADTVIIFDPDFNPHQDLQAISRAHRYGQTKTVLVFKLMVKGAAEERIIQSGKKKLALDHLIVQKMDENGVADDVQSILTFGAKAIFENSEVNDINYSEADIDKLIERTELEGDKVAETTDSGFGFAKLWVVEKDSMEEIAEDAPPDAEENAFWSGVLSRATAEKERAQATEITGRGAKRKAAAIKKYTYNYDEGSPEKAPAKRRKKSSDKSDDDDVSVFGTDKNPSSPDTGSDLSDNEVTPQPQPRPHPIQASSDPFLSGDQPPAPAKGRPPQPWHKPALSAIENRRPTDLDGADGDVRPCGLCQNSHGPGECYMTQNPANLVDYRHMLLNESRESMTMRRAAVQAIDSYLASRGLSYLVKGQGLSFVDQGAPSQAKGPRRPKKNVLSLKPEGARLESQGSGHQARQTIYPPVPDSSTQGRTPKVTQQRMQGGSCVVCGGQLHLIQVCPVVKQGPVSVSAAISRLSTEPQHIGVVNILRAILARNMQA